jgi:DNA-binding PadR family transcriptional regulator
MQEINQLTDGRVKVGAGTLYALLSRFEKDKIIYQVSDDGRRKTYALGAKGRKILKSEYNRLIALVEDGNKYLTSEMI